MTRFLVAANVAIPLAVLIFASGFFPYKPFMPGLASHADYAEHGEPPAAQFDKLIFMVVDALRSDFVFSSGSGFTFTQKLIRGGEAVPFTAHASPPTVTMPRVKAMTTGSIPSFVDAILNFAEADTTSSLAAQDTWLAQMRAGRDGKGGGRLVMFGDDTWLKLFPGDMFVRADGTSSFFVSDFTEVDRNVTRNIPRELRGGDWDAMILHYLGLDHIGHKAGPNSPNMIPKHMEMDTIVKKIYDAMTKDARLQSTLLVLCGDHGMNEAGNHGGSGPGETATALVFISPKLKPLSPGRKSPVTPRRGFDFYKKVDQSDLAATISSLMGLPVPRNNLGVMIPEFLALWRDPKDQMQLLLRNALQIVSLVKATFSATDFDKPKIGKGCDDQSSDADFLACKWSNATREVKEYQHSGENVQPSLSSLFEFCKKAQSLMSGTASNYDIPRMAAGISLAAIAFISAVLEVLGRFSLKNVDVLVFITFNLLYGVMMFASSYVEEEHHFWYWAAAGWLAYLRARCIQTDSKQGSAGGQIGWATATAMLAHRLLQRWNQAGQKHAGAPDIVTGFLFRRPLALWTVVALTYAVATLRLGRHLGRQLGVGSLAGVCGAALLAGPAVAFKVAFTAADSPELFYWLQGERLEAFEKLPLVTTARGIFGVVALYAVLLLVKGQGSRTARDSGSGFLDAFHSLLTLFLITQTRAHNIPLYLLFIVQHASLARLRLTPSQVAITALVLGHVSFFALGNSNALSSIDLSNAYNGVSGYNVLAVGVLVFVNNWAGPIWWAVSALVLMAQGHGGRPLGEKPRREWVEAEHKHLAATSGSGVDAARNPGLVPSRTSPFVDYFALSTLYISGSLLAVMAACLVLRTHLFIWTVFSPKYLYSMAWSLAYHFFVSLVLCGGLWSLKGRNIRARLESI